MSCVVVSPWAFHGHLSGKFATVDLAINKKIKVGFKILANHLKIPMEKTLAIGDNLNNIPVFKVVGRNIAIANAE